MRGMNGMHIYIYIYSDVTAGTFRRQFPLSILFNIDVNVDELYLDHKRHCVNCCTKYIMCILS